MTQRQENILKALKEANCSARTLSDIAEAPMPTVRRNIQALRKLGYDIESVYNWFRSQYVFQLNATVLPGTL